MSRIDSILSGSLVFRDGGTYLSEIRPGRNKITITGSLQVSGSSLLLNGSDIGLRLTTLESGQGADQVKFGAITLWTASMSDWSASIDEYVGNLNDISSSFNNFTGSTQTRLAELEYTSSLLDTTTSDINSRVSSIEGKTLLSSSAQLDDLGFLSASISGIISRSAQISELGFITGSKFEELDNIPQGILSSSAQVKSSLLNQDLDLGTGRVTADNINISGSIVIGGEDVLALVRNIEVFAHTGSYASANTDLEVTGSLNLNFNGVTQYFNISVGGEDKVRVNEEGILQLFPQTDTPSPVEGGIFFGDDDNLYLGVND